MAEKRYLLTPGPTPVPPEVLAALAEPVIHHRARDYREIYERSLARLGEVYRTQNDVLMFTTSGTGAFESAVANLTSPGDRQLVLSAGNFGERWAGLAELYGCDVQRLAYEWGETPSPVSPERDIRTAPGLSSSVGTRNRTGRAITGISTSGHSRALPRSTGRGPTS